MISNKSQGSIRLSGELTTSNLIRIEIADDGDGLAQTGLMKLKFSLLRNKTTLADRPLASANIHDRIQLCFGVEYVLAIMNNHKEGATVILKIPYLRQPPEAFA